MEHDHPCCRRRAPDGAAEPDEEKARGISLVIDAVEDALGLPRGGDVARWIGGLAVNSDHEVVFARGEITIVGPQFAAPLGGGVKQRPVD